MSISFPRVASSISGFLLCLYNYSIMSWCFHSLGRLCWKSPTPLTPPAPSLASSSWASLPQGGADSPFVLFSAVYLLTLMGNGSIICAVCWDQRLHTPMYILLCQLLLPRDLHVTLQFVLQHVLANFLSDNKLISFSGCFLQFYFLLWVLQNAFSWLLWHLIDTLPSAGSTLPHLMTGRLCANLVISRWYLALWFWIPIIIIPKCPSVGPGSLTTSCVTQVPCWPLTCTRVPVIELTSSTLSSLLLFIPSSSWCPMFGPIKLCWSSLQQLDEEKLSPLCGSHLTVVSFLLWISDGHVCEPNIWTWCWNAEDSDFVLFCSYSTH